MKKVLFVNAAVRSSSRTAALARYVIGKLGGEISEVRLCEVPFPTVTEDFLKMRDAAAASGDHSAEAFSLAREFASADEIVIAAPYYDLSFPAALKQYFEQINVIGVTFDYDDKGRAFGLCKAKRLVYVTTAGGPIVSDEYGCGYVRALAGYFYGISETVCFKAEGLDIFGADTGKLLSDAEKEIDRYFGE